MVRKGSYKKHTKTTRKRSPKKSPKRSTNKSRTYKKSPKKTSKKKVNEYFKLMTEAKKKKSPSFVYKGKTYVAVEHPNLGILYKAK